MEQVPIVPVQNQTEHSQTEIPVLNYKEIAKISVWQRLLLFTILFPLGLVAYIFAWARSISAMVNLSGDVGSVPLYYATSVTAMVLVTPALTVSGWIGMALEKFAKVQYANGYLILTIIDALYVYIISSIIVILIWRLFSKIPKSAAMISVVILWTLIVLSTYFLYARGDLKGIIGEDASPVSFDIEEKGYSWDDQSLLAEKTFAALPKETISDVLIYKTLAGFVPKSEVYNSVYKISSEFELNYQTSRNGKIIGNVDVGVTSYGSKAYLMQYQGDQANASTTPLVKLDDGNEIRAEKGGQADWIGYNMFWFSSRRMIKINGGYTPDSGLEGNFNELVQAYLDKYPSDSKINAISNRGSGNPN